MLVLSGIGTQMYIYIYFNLMYVMMFDMQFNVAIMLLLMSVCPIKPINCTFQNGRIVIFHKKDI